jgi:hypothetical protein
VAPRIVERHGADVHLPGEAPTSRPNRNLPNDLDSLKDVLRTAGMSVGLALAFHNMINSVKTAANMNTFVTALGDREAAMQTLLTSGETGIAVEPLVALIAGLGVEEAASRSSGLPTKPARWEQLVTLQLLLRMVLKSVQYRSKMHNVNGT